MEETTTHCLYFVTRKKRYCRMVVKNVEKYCAEHQNNLDISSTENKGMEGHERINCPLDPTHTCYRSKLAKHLTVCNARKLLDNQPEYIVKNINLDENEKEISRLVPLSQLDTSVTDALIKKILLAYDTLPEVQEIILKHNVLKETLDDPLSGRFARKHLTQNASLLAHLQSAGLIEENTCYIEFGAGKGNLTYWLAQAVKNKSDSCILLVDKCSHRHKEDNRLKKEDHNVFVKRIRADIADLWLDGVPEIQRYRNKVGIAKHLCGAATDLAIRCLTKSLQGKEKCNNIGLVLAFCCHHKCEYKSYIGKKFLEQHGFTVDEFPILCSIASWATCGFNLKDNNENQDIENIRRRESIGHKVKILLNQGRLEYLKSLGFQGSLYHYISTDVSLENVCIVVKRNSTSD